MKSACKIVWICLAIAFVSAICGCQNNGDIGHLFGTWRVESYTVDGIRPEDPLLSDVTISFQSDIVNIVTIVDNYGLSYSQFGTWSEDGDTMTFNFTHFDNDNPPGKPDSQYNAPDWLGMTSKEPMVMKVSDSKKDSFTLTWHDPEGCVKVYKLHKTW